MWILNAFGTLEVKMSCYKIPPTKTLNTFIHSQVEQYTFKFWFEFDKQCSFLKSSAVITILAMLNIADSALPSAAHWYCTHSELTCGRSIPWSRTPPNRKSTRRHEPDQCNSWSYTRCHDVGSKKHYLRQLYVGLVAKVRLSCYLVLLSVDSKTR